MGKLTVKSARARKLIVIWLTLAGLALAVYLGVDVPDDLVQETAEVLVEEVLAPEPEQADAGTD